MGSASKREARRLVELKVLERVGEIKNLQTQVMFLLIPAQREADETLIEKRCVYIADFVYDEFRKKEWKHIVEDCKGFKTKDYIIKRKLMLFLLGIRIRET
jgi:hypothetical protein